MENYHLVHYTANKYSESPRNLQSAAYNTGIEYSHNKLVLNENISPEIFTSQFRVTDAGPSF